ncbi:MAG: hypothetical protein Q9182_005372 [Xanthomendoza sp. 2 TL-2023]
MAANAATTATPVPYTFTRDPSAPLGSFENPHPYEGPTAATHPATATAPASVQASTPTARTTHHGDQPDPPTTTLEDIASYMDPEEIDVLFNILDANPTASDPQPANPPASTQPPAPPQPTTPQPPPTQLPPPTTHHHHRQQSPSRSRSRSRSHNRHVRFTSPETRQRANTEAANRAHHRAIQTERETRNYIDTTPPLPRHRRPPTPMPLFPPMMSGALPTPSDVPQQTPASHSRSSSSASTTDPLNTPAAPIPAAPSRNPGFHDPRRTTTTPTINPTRQRQATVSRPEPEEGDYDIWPRCAVCDDRPATIHKSQIHFCDGCFGQACAAEWSRPGWSRGRRWWSREG